MGTTTGTLWPGRQRVRRPYREGGRQHGPACSIDTRGAIRRRQGRPPGVAAGTGGRMAGIRIYSDIRSWRGRSAGTAARPRWTPTSCGLVTGASRPSSCTGSVAAKPTPAQAVPTSGAQRPDAWCATRRRTPRGMSRCGARASALAAHASTRWATSMVDHPTYEERWPWPPATHTRAGRLRPSVSRGRGDYNRSAAQLSCITR